VTRAGRQRLALAGILICRQYGFGLIKSGYIIQHFSLFD
jgi:hypothetical protein